MRAIWERGRVIDVVLIRNHGRGARLYVSQLGRQAELDILLDTVELRYFDRPQPGERRNDILDELVRCGRAGGDADSRNPLDPAWIHPAAISDEIARHAHLDADLTQPVGIGAVLGAHHDQQLAD